MLSQLLSATKCLFYNAYLWVRLQNKSVQRTLLAGNHQAIKMYSSGIVAFIFSFIVSACNIMAQIRTSAACKDLAVKIKSTQVFCDLEEYEKIGFVGGNGEIGRGWNFGNHNCNKKTISLLAVVRPNTTAAIAEVVRVASLFSIPVSMRCGGHSYTCNAIKPGSIHLDMRSMNNIEIIDNNIDQNPPDEESKLLKTGSGNTFRQLLKYTGFNTYSYVHGECHGVGVSGFYLHGGAHCGILTEKYGLGNASVRELEMVTAYGSILQFREKRKRIPDVRYRDYYRDQVEVVEDGRKVSGQNYTDLWLAMRVAGSSFGVVTSLTIQIFKDHEPYVFMFIIDLPEEEQVQLFFDAAEDEGVNINLFHTKIFGFTVFAIQISLTEGSSIKNIAEQECLAWLDDWMKSSPRRYNTWKVSRYKPFLTWAINNLLDLFGRQDYGTLYSPISDWSTSSITMALHDPRVKDVMRFYKEKYSQARGYCWVLFLQIDNRAIHGHRSLSIDFTCAGDPGVNQAETELAQYFPGLHYTKYYNVPSTAQSEHSLLPLYFPNYQLLTQIKNSFDPSGIFDQHQGIKAQPGL